MKTNWFSLSLPWLVVTIVVLAPVREVCSQAGVAPSQTGAFFDDLRARAEQFRQRGSSQQKPAGAAAAGVYDYSSGEYTGESQPEEDSDEGAPGSDGLARETDPQSYRSGYYGRPKRATGDYSGSSLSPFPNASTYFAPTYVTDPFLAGKRNIKLGPLNIGLGMGTSVEYNDNITSANTEQLDDIILGASLNIDANYRFTQRNQLSMAVSIGVDHYMNHPEESPRGKEYNVSVYPGSTLSFDFEVGEVHFSLYDRVSVRQASQSDFALDDRDVFGVFQNDIGLGMNWAVNSKTSLSLNINRSDSIALDEADASTDRTIDSVSGSAEWTPSGTYTLGLEGSYSFINYVEEFNNDGTTISAGVFLKVPITRNTRVKFSFGRQMFSFDTPPTFTRTVGEEQVQTAQAAVDAYDTNYETSKATIENDATLSEEQKKASLDALDAQGEELKNTLETTTADKEEQDTTENSRSFDSSNDFSDYYYNVTISNQLNAWISHQLSFGHESALNSSSNYITADYAMYGIGIIAWRGARLSISGYYEKSAESGGRLAEDVEQRGVDVLLTHRLTSRITAAVGYHQGINDSTTFNRDYKQRAYSLDLNYAVNQRLNVSLGFRKLSTRAEDELQSFDQKRITLAVTYNF